MGVKTVNEIRAENGLSLIETEVGDMLPASNALGKKDGTGGFTHLPDGFVDDLLTKEETKQHNGSGILIPPHLQEEAERMIADLKEYGYYPVPDDKRYTVKKTETDKEESWRDRQPLL